MTNRDIDVTQSHTLQPAYVTCLKRGSDYPVILVIKSGVYYGADSADGSIRGVVGKSLSWLTFWEPVVPIHLRPVPAGACFPRVGGLDAPVSFVNGAGGRDQKCPGL